MKLTEGQEHWLLTAALAEPEGGFEYRPTAELVALEVAGLLVRESKPPSTVWSITKKGWEKAQKIK